jgi:5-methylcytosine-specific restriction endonuclease McrA
VARPSGALVKNDGTWTAAKFNSFIKNNLRAATRKWAPIQKCKKRAHVARGLYKCEGCGNEVAPTYYDEDKRKRMKNIFVDHIVPIIDPATGFTTWDECIERMFCDSDNLQLLCKQCHSEKSREEIEIAKQRRAASKEEIEEMLNDDQDL